MQTRLRLLHEWTRQLHALLPAARATRVAGLSVLVLGLLWAGTASLPRVAAALPLPATVPSRERRLRRWLANPAVTVEALWDPLLPALLADRAGQDLLVVFDPTPQNATATVLCLGVVDHRRVLPLAWRVLPQQEPWPDRQIAYLRALLAEINAALPPGATVTLLGDRGVTGPALIDLCRELGWHYVLRLSVGAAQANKVRCPGERERRLWELVTGPGQRLAARVALYKEAGWRTVELTVHWRRGAAEPWVLVSDRPAGAARVREYRRRVRVEATYADCKRRGFDIERSKVAAPERLERLLLGLHLALWWAAQLGLRAIRAGQRRRFDRADRRDLSVLRLGRCWLAEVLAHDRCPPLPFRRRATEWVFTWLA